MKIEIERKFLLKSQPGKKPDYSIKVRQWYLKVDGVWERARQMSSKAFGKRWVHTVKTKISSLSCAEAEREMTKAEYLRFVRRCKGARANSRVLEKQRLVYEHEGLKWEVDVFDSCRVVIAEVEIPSEDYAIEIPDFIAEKTLIEVSGIKQFSSRSLSEKPAPWQNRARRNKKN